MRLGYDLTIEQSQRLIMTPELIQAIQILQFNTQELSSYVQEQLLTNPVLEPSPHGEEARPEGELPRQREEAPDPLSDYIRERGYDDPGYKQPEYSRDDKDYSFEQFVTTDITLPEHLMFQLQFASGNKACRSIGRYIIESLDENGYMTSTEEEIAEALGTSPENVRKVLRLVRTFDPVGVGARNLSECLLIQLENRGLLTGELRTIVTRHLGDIANNRLSAISKAVGLPVQRVQELGDIIKTLEPKPGRQFATQSETRYIVPDVIVEKVDGEYIVSMNDNSVPRLMVSSYYQSVLRESKNDEKLHEYLSERLNSALWLINSIEQRKQTILNVVRSIVRFQRDYFDQGDKHLRTLTLKQVAEEVGIHESTVSRSINGKYMQCPRGVQELKFFFSAGVSDWQGEGISSNSIKTHLREIIDGEDPKSPLSDQDLVAVLKERGIDISRRTVAKYRDEMNILSSSRRRRF